MIKYVLACVLTVAMFTNFTDAVSAQSCENGVCKVLKSVVSAPVNFVKEVQPVRRVAAVPVNTAKWCAANRPVRSLFGRVAKRKCCCS